MKCLKSFLLAIFLSIFIISSISYARGKTPSIFDRPEEGLYYILIINLSSMPLEVQIKFGNKIVCENVFLEPWHSVNSVFNTYLKLGVYFLLIKKKKGEWVETEFVLNQKYVDTALGPLTLEIYD